MARHAPVLRGVGVGSDGPPWVETKDPRRARAAHRGQGAEDPRGSRREGDELRQGRASSGRRDDAPVRASEVAAPGGGSGSGGDALGARNGRGRGERSNNYREGRPRGHCTSSSLMQRDREVHTWSHRNAGARGSWRGRHGRRGGRGYGRMAASDRFGGREGDTPEAGEIRPALHHGNAKASCYASDSDSSDGRLGAERGTTCAPAQRGRQLERDDFSDRERSRSPSVGQDRGSPPRQPTPPAARTLSPVPVRPAEPSSPSPPRQLVPDGSPPSPFNSSIPRAPVGPLRQSPPHALPERGSSEVVDSKSYPSRLQQDVAAFPKAALHYAAATVSQAPQPAPSRQASLLPRDSSSPPRRVVADPRAAASLHSGSASRNPRPLPASNGSQSPAHSQKAQGGLKRAVRPPSKEVVPHQGVKRVRVSEAQPAAQAAPVFSSDDEVQEVPAKSSAGQERGEWPHEFKFLAEAKDRACSLCKEGFVRICTACGKCVECVRGGSKDCVSSASQERQQSPHPQAYPGQRDWPEYPKTVTRNTDGTAVLEKRMERAIYEAIRTGDTNPMVGLLRAGVSPNFKRPAGETCLHAAAYCGAVDLVKYLRSQNADPSVKDSHGNLAVDLAAMQGNDEVVAFLQPLAPSARPHTIAAHQRHRQHVQLQRQERGRQLQQLQQQQQQGKQVVEAPLTSPPSQSSLAPAPAEILRPSRSPASSSPPYPAVSS